LGLLSSGSYSYPCFSPRREQQLDQCDLLEEEPKAAESEGVEQGGKAARLVRSGGRLQLRRHAMQRH
jgi:hypothetical protein